MPTRTLTMLPRSAICTLLLFGGQVLAQEHVVKPDADGVQRVRILGGSYFFKPAHIVVKVNVPIELSASREPGIAPHNFVLKAPEAGIAVDEELGSEPKKIVFKPLALGKYPFYCSKKLPFIAGHRERGMEGTIEVVP
jgi:hypothetical protein